MVAAFTDARSVAYYALASRISDVVGLPASGLAASLFSRMAREDHLRSTWLAAAWVLGLAATVLACLLVGPFLRLVIGIPYLPAAGLLPPLALAQVVRSVTSLYNAYLAAHARGVELRNAAVALTAANVLLNVALIPTFGAVGAAWASLGALLVNLGAHVAYYRRSAPAAMAP
jgi:O-antigen/teichoic acid export membrane protein